MTETESPVLSYATTLEKPSLTVGQYLFYLIATSLFLGLIMLPGRAVLRSEHFYEDFKLELPWMAQLAVDFYNFMTSLRADIWISGVPFVVPFGLVRIRPEIRNRLLFFGVLVAALIGFFAIMSMVQVLDYFLSSMTGKT